MCDTYNKMIDEYEKFAKNIIIYDSYSGGFLFQNLTEEKMEENVYGTYKNILNYGFKEDDHTEFIDKSSNYFKKIIKLFNEEDISHKIDEIREKYGKNFYSAFCFIAESVKLLARTGNLLYTFLIFISKVDFRQIIKNDNNFLEGCLLVQRLNKLIIDVIFLHWKKQDIIKKSISY